MQPIDFDITIPRKIKEEVNEGEHFAELRRIYSAMLLASWIKGTKNIRNKHIADLVDSGKPKSLKLSITNIGPVNDLKDPIGSLEDPALRAENYSHAIPSDPAFEVPENVEFFAKYVRLFKNGLFKCARNEAGDSPEDRIIRVYFSGAIDFRNMGNIIEITG